MKGLGTILIILGIIAIAFSVYGFTQNESEMRLASALVNAFGVAGELPFGDQLKLFAFDNRIALLIVGVLAGGGGIVLRKKG